MKPFLKWAGGKSSVLPQIIPYLPSSTFKHYLEPFLGGGAMFFYLASKNYITRAVLSDISTDLINCYVCIKENPTKLIQKLDSLTSSYFKTEEKEAYFYNIRTAFNLKNYADVFEASAMFIFLNKTCFNGLFRLNSKGEFNTPFGFYKKPYFYDAENILSCHKALQIAELTTCDFSQNAILPNSFIYLDPPYKPISKTSSFNSYSKVKFTDEEQERLANFIKSLTKEHLILLSNSSPNENFFYDLYEGFYINKIKAARSINSVGSKRQKVEELLISNYNNYANRAMEFDF